MVVMVMVMVRLVMVVMVMVMVHLVMVVMVAVVPEHPVVNQLMVRV